MTEDKDVRVPKLAKKEEGQTQQFADRGSLKFPAENAAMSADMARAKRRARYEHGQVHLDALQRRRDQP